MKETFALYLKKLREKRGLSLRKLADLSKGSFSHAYLGQLETGVQENPSTKILYHLSKIYGVSADEIAKKCVDSLKND